jgi:hypothetical protein
MWFLVILVILVITGVRLLSKHLDPEGAVYEEGTKGPVNNTNPSDNRESSMENFTATVQKSQMVTEDDGGTVKVMKNITKFSTHYMPMFIPSVLNFVVGGTYAFSFVLFFLMLIPVLLFNVFRLHYKIFEHKVFLCLFENAWLCATFFWLLNMWVTHNY